MEHAWVMEMAPVVVRGYSMSVEPPGVREGTFSPRCGAFALTQDSLQQIPCVFLEVVGVGWGLGCEVIAQIPCNWGRGESVMVQEIIMAGLWGPLAPQASKAWLP